jgi:hypothetical protein
VESPLLSAYFIKELNAALKTNLHIPVPPPATAAKKQAKLF